MSRTTGAVVRDVFLQSENCNLTDLIEMQKCRPQVRAGIKFV